MSETTRQRARRLPAQERRAAILLKAASFFAAEGFSASTRDLAESMGIRQALLYRYFPSKEILIESVLEAFVKTNWNSQFSSIISDRTMLLEDRLKMVFLGQLENETEIAIRLLLHAVLDRWKLPVRLFDELDKTLILPLVEEMRHINNFPTIQALPLMVGERELAFALYGSINFYSLRQHLYKSEVCNDKNAVTKLYVDAFLKGAVESLKALHQPDATSSLTKPFEHNQSTRKC